MKKMIFNILLFLTPALITTDDYLLISDWVNVQKTVITGFFMSNRSIRTVVKFFKSKQT